MSKITDAASGLVLASRANDAAWRELRVALDAANASFARGAFVSYAGEYCVSWRPPRLPPEVDGFHVCGERPPFLRQDSAPRSVQRAARRHRLSGLMEAARQTDRAYVAASHALAALKPQCPSDIEAKRNAIITSGRTGYTEMALASFDEDWGDYYDEPASVTDRESIHA